MARQAFDWISAGSSCGWCDVLGFDLSHTVAFPPLQVSRKGQALAQFGRERSPSVWQWSASGTKSFASGRPASASDMESVASNWQAVVSQRELLTSPKRRIAYRRQFIASRMELIPSGEEWIASEKAFIQSEREFIACWRSVISTPHPHSLSPLSRGHLIRPAATFSPSDTEKGIEAEREAAPKLRPATSGTPLPASSSAWRTSPRCSSG